MSDLGKRSAVVLLLTTGLVLSACTSGSGGQPRSNPGGSSRNVSGAADPSSPAQSVSVPPDVPKDSIRDLNSTKDMTGVVTTIPENQSPYVGHLPEVCPILMGAKIIPQGKPSSLNRPMHGNYLSTCNFMEQSINKISGTVGIFTETIEDLNKSSINVLVKSNVPLGERVQGHQLRTNIPQDNSCIISWGTFFGAADVIVRSSKIHSIDTCAKALETAKAIVENIPKSPIEMRK